MTREEAKVGLTKGLRVRVSRDLLKQGIFSKTPYRLGTVTSPFPVNGTVRVIFDGCKSHQRIACAYLIRVP